MEAIPALSAGDRLGDYLVERRLRIRDDVVVYRGSEPSVDRDVALYVARAPADTAATEEFLSLARTLAGVEHPALVPIYGLGTAGASAYVAARLSGTPADVLLVDGPLSEPAAVAVVEDIAGAVEALQRAGLPSAPHPSQVLVEGGRTHPAAVLAPLESRASAREPSAELADLLATLSGAPDSAAVSSARAAAASSSPTQVAAAARAALVPSHRPRRRRTAAVLLIVAALGAAGAAVALRGDRTDDRDRRAPAEPARIAATIPIGGEPISMAAAGDTLWVATTAGRLVRVDTRTNRVVGSPVRLRRQARDAQLTIFTAAGMLYAMAGDSKLLFRLDPSSGRVLRQRRLGHGTPLAGTVVDGVLWVTRQPFDDDPTGRPQALPLDPRTLEDKGRPVPVGLLPAELIADGSALLVVGLQDGTVTRIDTRTRDARQVLVTPKPGVPALLRGNLWIPDGGTGAVTGIASELRRPPATVAPVGEAPAAVAARDALWVLVADQQAGPHAPARLVRLDASGRAMAGRPVQLGRGGERMIAAAGDLWISSMGRKAVLRLTPSGRVPTARPLAEAKPNRLANGPARPGRRSTKVNELTVSIDAESGWLVTAVHELLDLRRFDDPEVGVAVMVPDQVYGRRGSAQSATSASAVLRVLRAVPELRMTRVRSIRVDGMPARTALLAVRPFAKRSEFCPGPCVPLIGRERVTQFVSAPARARLTLVDVDGRTVGILEDTPDGDSLAATGELVRSLRLG